MKRLATSLHHNVGNTYAVHVLDTKMIKGHYGTRRHEFRQIAVLTQETPETLSWCRSNLLRQELNCCTISEIGIENDGRSALSKLFAYLYDPKIRDNHGVIFQPFSCVVFHVLWIHLSRSIVFSVWSKSQILEARSRSSNLSMQKHITTRPRCQFCALAPKPPVARPPSHEPASRPAGAGLLSNRPGCATMGATPEGGRYAPPPRRRPIWRRRRLRRGCLPGCRLLGR